MKNSTTIPFPSGVDNGGITDVSSNNSEICDETKPVTSKTTAIESLDGSCNNNTDNNLSSKNQQQQQPQKKKRLSSLNATSSCDLWIANVNAVDTKKKYSNKIHNINSTENDDDNAYSCGYDGDTVYQVPAATADGKNPITISTIISSGAGHATSEKSTCSAADENDVVDENDYAYAKRILFAINFVVGSSRMEPFVAVYYIVFKEWNPTKYGVVSLVMSITMLVAQTPVGDILDKTTHKKLITAGAAFIAAVTTTSVAWTSNFWFVVVIKAIEGLATTFFHLSLTLLIFGIVRTKEEAPKFVAQTEVTNKIGSALITIMCGLLAYFLYPNIASIFYLLGASGVIAAVLLLLIPFSAIDDNGARQLEEQDHENFDSNSELGEEEEVVNDTCLELTTLDTADNENVENKDKNKCIDSANNENEELTAATYMYLIKDKNIAMFAFITFVYKLANAGIQPLVAQHLAIENERFSMIFTSAVLLLNYFAQAITAQVMTKAVDKVDSKTLLVLAYLVLPIRCGLLAIMIKWWDNDYAILSTQLLHGIGGGIYKTIVPIVVSKFTVGTGRFGVVFGFIMSCWRVGGGFSYLLAETIWHQFGAEVAFLSLGGIGIISLVILVFGVTVPTYEEAKAKDIVRESKAINSE